MPSTAGPVDRWAGSALTHVLVYEDNPQHSAEVAGLLEARGYRATLAGSATEAEGVLKRDRPGALIVVDHDAVPTRADDPGTALRAAAAALDVPTLVVVDDPTDPSALADRLVDADDWVSLGGLATEMPIRLARLMKRAAPAPAPAGPGSPHRGGPLVIGPRFISLVVHDLRTPLNVIGLSLRMISQAVPGDDPELEEDLRFVEENFRQIERMLTQLSDYYRLHDPDGTLMPVEFSPPRLVDELLEARQAKAGMRASPVTVEATGACPAEVTLDLGRARLAVQYAVSNAAAAANGEPIRVVLRGGRDRWVTEVVIDHPPPSVVKAVALSPDGFERLCGVAAERRGMDLAIAAKVSELFGGTARLDVEPGRMTAVVLDWPARLAPA
jgi:DNA-binding response OmpR family regulator